METTMSRQRLAIIFFFFGLVLVSSIAAQVGSARPSWPIKAVPAEWRALVSRADVIIVAMHDSLLRQLHGKLTEGGGPAAALGACHIDTTSLIRRVGRYEGIAAGLTSDRVRNSTNKPRDWAAPLVAEYAGREARDVDGFAVDLGNRIGVLRPLMEQNSCVNCHGPLERISPAVRTLIAERYPADRAMGFAEGQIRGWYWVEMPKPAQ
jgi:hypothetical protein